MSLRGILRVMLSALIPLSILIAICLVNAPSASAKIVYDSTPITTGNGLNAGRQLSISFTGTISIINSGSGTNGRMYRYYSPDGTFISSVSLGSTTPVGLAIYEPTGAIYVTVGSEVRRIESDGSTTAVITGLSTPQGLALNADESNCMSQIIVRVT